MTLAIYIPVFGPVTVGPLIDMNVYVGGYAAWVGLTPDLGMMVADHGKVGPFSTPPYTTQPQNFYGPNVRATWLYSTFRGLDWIMGPAVILGEPYFTEGDELQGVQPTRKAISGLFADYDAANDGRNVCDWCRSADYDLAFDLRIVFKGHSAWGFTCLQCAIDSMKGSPPRLGTGYGQIMVPEGQLDKLGKENDE